MYDIKITVVAFLVFPGHTNGFNAATLQNQVAYRHEKRSTAILRSLMGKNMYFKFLR